MSTGLKNQGFNLSTQWGVVTDLFLELIDLSLELLLGLFMLFVHVLDLLLQLVAFLLHGIHLECMALFDTLQLGLQSSHVV